jgi:hypothetical protein
MMPAEGRALARQRDTGQGIGAALAPLSTLSFDNLQTLAQLLAASGFFQDTKDAAQALTKIIAGAELGFGPVASMTGIHIVQGRVTMSANLIGAAIKRSGRYDYRVREIDDTVCRLEFFERGESVGITAFSWADAERANLAGKPIWKQYPRNLLFARAMSNGARFYCPDVFGGPIYTPEELGAPVHVTEDGAVEVANAPVTAPVTPVVTPAVRNTVTGAAIEPVTERTRLLCAGFVEAVTAANPKVKPRLPADEAGDAAWLAWLEQKSAEWTASVHNPANKPTADDVRAAPAPHAAAS